MTVSLSYLPRRFDAESVPTLGVDSELIGAQLSIEM